MGLFRRIISKLTGGLVSPEPPRRSHPPAEPEVPTPWFGDRQRYGQREPGWGAPFGADHEVETWSVEGYHFTWHIAGWKQMHGEREDLEADPARVLTDQELLKADYLVVHFSGPIGYVVISGPFSDWDDVYDDIAVRYDEGPS